MVEPPLRGLRVSGKNPRTRPMRKLLRNKRARRQWTLLPLAGDQENHPTRFPRSAKRPNRQIVGEGSCLTSSTQRAPELALNTAVDLLPESLDLLYGVFELLQTKFEV